MGLLLAGITVAFEFLFGRYVDGKSWEYLLADYNIFKGKLWILVIITSLTAPYLIKKAAMKHLR